MSKNTRQNGAAQLPDPVEQMRLQVVELEMKARYWKAQHDIRFYTLQSEKLQAEYDTYLQAQQKMQEELQAAMREKLTIAGLLNEDGSTKTDEQLAQNQASTPVDELVEENTEGRV